MFKTLIDNYANIIELPIEVEDIAAKAQELTGHEKIHFYPTESDPAKVRGVCYTYDYRPGVYADPITVTQIVYTNLVDLAWQRVICCKELVHLFDGYVEKTDTVEEVDQLLEKLLGKMSTEDYGLADLMAAKDRLALYQALPLLLPQASLTIARQAVAAGEKTPEEVAEWATLPVEFVRLMLSEHWENLNGALLDC